MTPTMTHPSGSRVAPARRNPARLLTGRGYAFGSAGIVLVVAGMFADQRDVLRVGLLLVAILVLALVLVTGARLRLGCRRNVAPDRVQLGSTLTGQLDITANSRLPAGMVLLQDQVPPELGQQPRFTLDRPGRRRTRTVRYPLVGRVRGRWTCGPLQVHITDPFGLVRMDRRFTGTTQVLVTPRIEVLAALDNAGDRGRAGEAQAHRVGILGTDDVLIREYRDGDDVRRVHWPSTARRGELMVRREEQASDHSARIILDSRGRAHTGSGTGSSLEWAISAAASIGLHLLSQGYALQMFDAAGRMAADAPGGQQSVSAQLLIHQLSDLPARRTSSLQYGIDAAAATRRAQHIVAILGRLTTGEATSLLQTHASGAGGMAILLDVDSFGETAADDMSEPAAAAVLRENGWRVVVATYGMSVADAWRRFHLQAVR